MAVKIQPLGDRVVVKPLDKEEKTKGGIFLPDTAKEKPQEGKVLAVGPGKMSDEGKRLPMDVAAEVIPIRGGDHHALLRVCHENASILVGQRGAVL